MLYLKSFCFNPFQENTYVLFNDEKTCFIIDPGNYSSDENKVLKDFLNSITTHIPQDKADYVWNSYKKINNTNENQPCTCGSSAGHWRRAVDYIFNWVKERA